MLLLCSFKVSFIEPVSLLSRKGGRATQGQTTVLWLDLF